MTSKGESCGGGTKNAFSCEGAEKLTGLVEYGEGAIVSRTIIDQPEGTVTLFAFDKGQRLSEHQAPFDALVQVIEGRAETRIGGRDFIVEAGEIVIMPANVPHGVRAPERCKMLLTMVKHKAK